MQLIYIVISNPEKVKTVKEIYNSKSESSFLLKWQIQF